MPTPLRLRSLAATGALALGALVLAACRHAPATAPTPAPSATPARGTPLLHAIVPRPATFEPGAAADSFTVTPRTPVVVDAAAGPEVEAVGTYAAQLLASGAGAAARRLGAGERAPDSSVALVLDPSRTALGGEGYDLQVTAMQVRIVAAQPAGLFYGVQTLRQLLPPSIEHASAFRRRLRVPAVHVADAPRYAWRGTMLDVARHFLPASDVKRFVDLLALYKLNRLHLHLADDQGWRIEIRSWPRLTEVGGRTQIDGGPGGFYTQAEYADIVAYAKSRFVTVVPEIDMPGHISAALASYPDLRCNRTAPAFGRVGGPPNVLCVERDSVYTFIGDVVREVAAAAPTPYFHIGGDEVDSLTTAQYRGFIARVDSVVRAHGPRVIGWGEIAPARIATSTIVQHWTRRDSSAVHALRGGQVILSPAERGAYLDMKYDSTTTLGLLWAGAASLSKTYGWDPSSVLAGAPESSILGVEGPLWSETLVTRQDYEYLAFPRLAAIAEIGWTPPNGRRWDDFRLRIGAHGARLAALGVNFARVPEVDWTW